MKLNFKKSFLSIFSSEQEVAKTEPEKILKKSIDFENEDYERALKECDIPENIVEAITDIVNKPLPEVILKTIDREAEKTEIKDELRPIFGDYVKYLLYKAENSDGEPLFIEGDDNVELVAELEENLKITSQRCEDYKTRYLSAERQKRALSDKVRDLEEKNIKQEKEFEKSENLRIEANNSVRNLAKEVTQLKESNEHLKLEVENFKQLEINNNLMGMGENFTETEFIESLKKRIVVLETANGEMEEKLLAEQEHLKEVTESFETTLHVKEETVKQAVEREKVLQARIETLQNENSAKPEIIGDEALTERLIDVTRKYQALQSELSKYKNQIYEESEGELKKEIEKLSADLALANEKLAKQESNNNSTDDDVYNQMVLLREKLESADTKIEQLENEIISSKQSIEEKDKEIAQLKEFPEYNDKEVEELKSQITNLQVELENKNNQLTASNEKIEKLQVKRERANESKRAVKEIERLTDQLILAEKNQERYKKEAEIARLNVVALTHEVEALKASLPQNEPEQPFDMEEDNWMVVMEPETEEEIRERRRREQEKERKEEEEANAISMEIPFDDPAQMKLWD